MQHIVIRFFSIGMLMMIAWVSPHALAFGKHHPHQHVSSDDFHKSFKIEVCILKNSKPGCNHSAFLETAEFILYYCEDSALFKNPEIPIDSNHTIKRKNITFEGNKDGICKAVVACNKLIHAKLPESERQEFKKDCKELKKMVPLSKDYEDEKRTIFGTFKYHYDGYTITIGIMPEKYIPKEIRD